MIFLNYKLLLIPYLLVAICFLIVSIVLEKRCHKYHTILQGAAKIIVLFLIGGMIYVLIELGFRGKSHWSMFLLGGFCFIQLGLINEFLPWKMPIELQAVLGAILITINELIVGLIVNLGYGLNVWDYTNMPFNIMGQVCIPFTIIWFFIAIVGIVVDDILRFYLWDEESPEYYLSSTGQTIYLALKK